MGQVMKRIKNISLLRRMSIFRGFIVLLSLYLLIASILPLFGWQLFIYGPFKLDAFDPIVGNALFLVITKSASFMTLSFFALNYLQNRKPLSSVAPLLVYSNFTIIFGVIFLIQSDNTQWSHWALVFLLSVISVILLQENSKSFVRLLVDSGGCSGFSYKFSVDKKINCHIIKIGLFTNKYEAESYLKKIQSEITKDAWIYISMN